MASRFTSTTTQRATSAAVPSDQPRRYWRVRSGVAVLAALLTTMMSQTQPLAAQSFSVLHSFTGGADGSEPSAGLLRDGAGNLYGTTIFGGTHGFGLVFKMSQRNSGWVLVPLYSFAGGDDGAEPQSAPLTFGPDGALYGTTPFGGGNGCFTQGCGTLFKLTPSPTRPASPLTPWNETVLFRFTETGGFRPSGAIAFDHAGNVYGSTTGGGDNLTGVVYQLSPSGSGFTQSTLYNFPFSGVPNGVLRDQAGNLYGTARGLGGRDFGNVFEVSPSGSGWTERTLYTFQFHEDGGFSYGGLIADLQGNLYGSVGSGGTGGGGAVFQMSPAGGGGWTHTTLSDLAGTLGPQDNLAMDAAGNLYGTAFGNGAFHKGNVFKLTPGAGGWTYTSLHDFTGGDDGAFPFSSVAIDSNGNLYGTASSGGTHGVGVVWQITP